MNAAAEIRIHPSQFPDQVRRDLLQSLRSRRINHKFHYDSVKQTQKWLALHEAFSPARSDAGCRRIYDQSFRAAAAGVGAKQVHVIGLGCGGGQKDARLLQSLQARGKKIRYTPCDVAAPMVLVARQAALKILPDQDCLPFVCDLATAGDLPRHLATRHPSLVTFFGMIPNFEPNQILPKLASLVRPQDWLLFSANLAPGDDYAAGVRKILPQYDNGLTRDWLMTFLFDLGVGRRDGQLRFHVEPVGDLLRVAADFRFVRRCRLAMDGERFDFGRGDVVRLFFSYRYTPDRIRRRLAKHRLEVLEEWIAGSGEEGVFLCRRAR